MRVTFKVMKPATVRKRFRQCFSKHLNETAIHTQRFIEGKGSTSNHFGHFDVGLMKRCIELKVTIDNFLKDYHNWIKQNLKSSERYLNY